MRQFILTILIISNVGGSFEIATDFDGAWAEAGIFTSVDGLQTGLLDNSDEPAEEIDCDHCCHGASHFAGAIVSCPTVPYVRASSGDFLAGTPYQFVSQSPPTPPPNA